MVARLFTTVLNMTVLSAVCTGIHAQQPRLEPSTAAGYAISGIVRDARLQPVRAARVEVLAPGFEGRFVLSDRNGRYFIRDLAGGVRLHASKEGYFSNVSAVAAAGDAIVDFILQPIHRIAIGEPIRDVLTADHPLCVGDDRNRPESREVACHRLLVTPFTSGTLDVLVTWDRSSVFAVDLIAPDGRSIGSSASAEGAYLTMPVDKGSDYEVRIIGDRRKLAAPQKFEVKTTLR